MKKTLRKALPMLFVGLPPGLHISSLRRRQLVLLAALLLCNSAIMAQIYVSPSGNDANTGTAVSPRKTIQAGVDIATAGQTVFIAAGTYAENVTISKDNITLKGEGSGANGNSVPVAPNALTHTIISGGSGSRGIQLSGARTNVSVTDIAILDHTMEGFFAPANSVNLIIKNLQVNGNCTGATGRGGIFVSGDVTDVTISGCAVQNNGPGASARGIAIWDNYKAGVTITNNYVVFTACCGIDLNDGTSSGVIISNNTLIAGAGGDSAIGVLGMKSGAGANIIANNTITIAKRYGIEIKNPAGSGEDSETADGAIVVRNNTITRTGTLTDNRDLAGIAVFRRSFTAGNPSGYIDVPSGVVIKANIISGFLQPDAQGEGYGVVVEGVKMTVKDNTVSNSDVGIQRQAGNTAIYVKNNQGDADQAAVSNYFGRGNSPFSSSIILTNNTLTGNIKDTNDQFAPGTYFVNDQFVFNIDKKTNHPTITSAVEYAAVGNTLQPSANTFDELVDINKSVTIDGVSKTDRFIKYTGAAITTVSVIAPALFKVSAPNVTIKNLSMEVDLAKIWSAILSNGDVAGLSIVGNNIKATRSATTSAAGYTDRNAIGINISGRAIPGIINASNPSGLITVQNNIISYTSDPTPANVAAFRAAIAVDNYNVLVEGNTTAAVNHDVTNRFQTTTGQSILRNNTFNGGGIEFSEPNGPSNGALFENNTFDYQLGGFPTFALVRFKNNDNNKPFIFKNNQVKNHYWLMSLENFQNIDVEGNIFTPVKNVDNYFQILSINTKTISSSNNTKIPLSANIVGNTFKGVSGGINSKGIAFYNHDNAAPQFGNIVIGAVGKLNTFEDNITNYLYLDNNNGNATKDGANVGLTGYPEYGLSISLTTTGYWTTDIRADQNMFFVDSQIRTVASLNQAQRSLLDAKIFDKVDNVNIGKVNYYFPVKNLTTSEGFASIQAAIDDSDTQNGNIVNVDEGTYILTDAVKITKGIILQGNANNLVGKPIITGVGNIANKALIEVDASGVSIKNFEFQIAQTGNALVGITTLTNDNFNNLTIADNTFKGMKAFDTGLIWTSFAMKLGRGSAGVVGGVPNNLVNVVRNTVTYSNASPDLFGRGIYAFNTYGKIGGAIADKNTITAAYALQSGELGGGLGKDFEFSYNEVPVGIVSAVGAEAGSHKINNNNIGAGITTLAQANGIVRLLEVKGNRTASANIEVANNLVQNYGNIGIFIQRSDDVTIKNNILTPFSGANAFNSIVFSSKEGTSGVQAAVRLENLSITGNTFNGAGSNLGTGIAFWNHNGSASVIPLINAKIGGSDADKNTFSSDLVSYISLDATPSGGNTGNALMGTLYDITQVGFPDRITNIFPFNGDVDASYNVFGATNTGTETNFDNLLAVKAKISDGIDNSSTGYVNIQPQKAFIATQAKVPTALSVVPENFTLVLKNDAAVYANLGSQTITKAHTFAIDNYTTGEITFDNLTLNALAKEVTFTQAAKVTGDFTVTEGKINAPAAITLNGAKVIAFNPAKPTNFINGKVKVLNAPTTGTTLVIGKGNASSAVGLLELTTASDFEFEYFPNPYTDLTSFDPAVLGSIYNKEYWTIDRTSGSGNAKVRITTFDLTGSGFTSFNAVDATVARFSGAAWVNANNSANSLNLNVGAITSNLNADFGIFTFAKTPLAVLPIKLTSFTAQATTGGALVKWSTSEEKNNAKFEIEKSFDGKNFFVIDTKNGKGNSATVANYEFLDLSFKQSAYYRLVQVDANGDKTTYSDLAKFVKGLDNSLSVVAYPNPVSTKLYVTVGATSKENVKLMLTDLTGKTLKLKAGDSVQPIELDVADVARGTYILQVIKDSGNVSKKILKL